MIRVTQGASLHDAVLLSAVAVPRLRVPSSPSGPVRESRGQVSDEVELYHRTYTTLLRSSG